MEEIIVKILGTEYKIIDNVSFEEMPENADGCMDQSTKTIKKNISRNLLTYLQ